jgi:phospholipid/cholesterol/gamma-HCH transport system substrate-binding protein
MKRSTFITWDQLKVGLVIMVGLLVLIFAVYRLGQAANLFTKRYELIAFLPSASGLREGGMVAVAGQLAGRVSKIDFLPPDGDTTRNLRLTLQVDEGLMNQIRADSKAQLRTQGLLGDKVLDISPGTPRYAALEPGDTVQVSASLDYEQVIARASLAVDDMVSLTKDLKLITGGIVRGEGTVGQLVTNRSLYDEMTETLNRTNTMMARLQNPNGSFGRMLEDPALYENTVRMLASVDSLLRQMNSSEGTMGKLLRDDSLYTSLVGITTGADSLMSMLSGGEGFAAKMLRDQQLYDQLNKLVTDLNAILEDVRRDPGKYTKGMIKVF